MTYTSFLFFIFVLIMLALYYAAPLRFRWVTLLAGSIAFYFFAYKTGWQLVLVTIMATYGAGLLLDFLGKKYPSSRHKLKKAVLALAVLSTACPWFLIKNGNFVLSAIWNRASFTWVVPLGISFYTLQIISYLSDVYKGKITAQKNPAKYALFILFFPQIVQGPIPRYERLAKQLYEGHVFVEKKFVKGCQLVLWGFFLKLMIADKAVIVVNEIFDNPDKYAGCYVAVGAALYNIQLYADFLACVTISQGVASLFGIELADNFRHPYFSTSIKEFWRRWHISLSEWLRDYIYIPLGGSRKGKLAKYANLMLTFVFSGLWHGTGYKYIVWGLIHASYQVAGELTAGIKDRIYQLFGLSKQSGTRKIIQCSGVFFQTAVAEIIFGANSLRDGLKMIKSLFCVHNPWIFFNDSLLKLGLDKKDWNVLVMSMAVFFAVSCMQEKGLHIREMILAKSVYIRWFLYIAAILCIMTLGTYGFGFNVQEFVYGGF